MPYCINPDCSQRINSLELAVCQSCHTPLVIQNRYRLLEPLQMTDHSPIEVFEVEDFQDPDRRKILKVLNSRDPIRLNLFTTESRLLTELRHPGIPIGEAAFSLTLASGRIVQCLVMERIPGQDLQTWLNQRRHGQKGAIAADNAIDWLQQLTSILRFVHSRGFFHRDIKPSNIMVRPDGQLVLIDFGSAREIAQDGRRVTVVGTPGYLAPEQLHGQAVPQSDFFALGRTVIYWLTGLDPTNDSRACNSYWPCWIDDSSTPQRLVDLLQTMTALAVVDRPKTPNQILTTLDIIRANPLPPFIRPSETCDETMPPIKVRKRQSRLLRWAIGLAAVGLLAGVGKLGSDQVNPVSSARIIPACNTDKQDYLSCGEETLIDPETYSVLPTTTPESERDRWSSQQEKALIAFRNGYTNSQKFIEAQRFFDELTKQYPNPEMTIYRNNAQIRSLYPIDQIMTIAVAVPLRNKTERGLEMLRGAAQAQTAAIAENIPMQIVIADDTNKRDGAKIRAERLSQRDDVMAVIGHHTSTATTEALEIYRNQLALISSTSTSNTLSNQPYFFRTVPKDAIAAMEMARYSFQELKQKKAAIFYSKDSVFGESLAKSFRDKAEELKAEVLPDLPEFDLANSQFKAESALDTAFANGATVIALIADATTNTGSRSIERAYEVIHSNPHHAWIVGGDSLYDDRVWNHPNSMNNLERLKKINIAISWHILSSKNNPQFVEEAQRQWKTGITWRTATTYDAVLVMKKVFKQFQDRKQYPNRKSALEMLKKSDFAVENGATGEIRFDKSDRANGSITLVTVCPKQDGSGYEFVPRDDRPDPCAK